MKHIFFLCLLLLSGSAFAGAVNDTIPYWHVSYGSNVIVRGNINSPTPKDYELIVKPDAVKDLIVSFIYDSGQPESSSLIVKEKNDVLRTFESDPVMGAYFRVPVKELIGTHQSNVRYVLDFYYTDDRGQKDRKLATIIFSFK